MDKNDAATPKKTKKARSTISAMLKSNRFIFAISLIAAILLWVTVTPNRETTIGMTVNIDTADTAAETLGLKVVSGQGQSVDVTVAGKWYVISELTDKDIKLTYSLGDVTKTGEYELVLSASKAAANSDYEIVKVNPETIKVSFDYIYTRSFKIEAKAPNIKASEGFILDSPVIDSDNSIIDITGPRSIVEKIASVQALVDNKATLSSAMSYTVPLTLYDSIGKEISSDQLTLPFTEVGVTVPINKSKSVPLTVDFANAPEYYQKNPLKYTLSVQKINVVGSAEVIDSINGLSLGTIDFSEISPSKNSFTFDLKLPSGVKSIDDIDKITCKLDTSGIKSKSVEVTSFTTVNAPTTAKVSIVTTKKAVTVAAPENVIGSIRAADLYLECDMSSYTENKGEIVADAVLKSKKYNSVWGVGKYQIQIKVS